MRKLIPFFIFVLTASALGAECTDSSSIEYGTCGPAATRENYGRTFQDLTLQSNDRQLVVTAIPALAGAIASVKYKGHELIATGGHGASFQYSVHPSYPSRGLKASECDNPTEAGNQEDYRNGDIALPALNPSSTGIISYGSTRSSDGRSQIGAQVNMAYFTPENVRSLYEGDCSNYSASKLGYVRGKNSNFILSKWVTMGRTINGRSYPHVLQFDAKIDLPRGVEDMDVILVAYLTRMMTKEILVDPRNNQIYRKRRGEARNNPAFTNSTTAPVARIFSNDGEDIAIGVLVPNRKIDPKESKVPTNYTTTDADFGSVNTSGEQYFQFSNAASQHFYKNLAQGTSVEQHALFVVGSVSEISQIAREYCQELGGCR